MKLLLLLLILLISFYWSGCAIIKPARMPVMPDKATVKKIVAEAQAMPIKNFYMGQADVAEAADGSLIWYESIGDISKPTILLIMGHSTSGIVWSSDIIDPFKKDYHIIRYDNRDVGGSSWPDKGNYNIKDMAEDAIAILDKMNIEKAHIVGVSMGGMIGQQLVLDHPERALTLTSFLSTAYYFDPKIKSVTFEMARAVAYNILKFQGRSMEQVVKSRASLIAFLRRDKEIDEELIHYLVHRIRFDKKENRDSNPLAGNHHSKAIRKSGSRLERMQEIRIPTLLLHGTDDPLIVPAHTEKYSQLIENCEVVWLEGMGHIPRSDHEQRIAQEIKRFIEVKSLSTINP